MDGDRFDSLARAFVLGGSRRRLLAFLPVAAGQVAALRTANAGLAEQRGDPQGRAPGAEFNFSQCPKPGNPLPIRLLDRQCAAPSTNNTCDVPCHHNRGPKGLFLRACQAHDRCYTTCGSTAEACNKKFFKDMTSACEREYRGDSEKDKNEREICLGWARLYRDGVVFGAKVLGVHRGSQNEACCHANGERCSSLSECNNNPPGSMSCQVVPDCNRFQKRCCLNAWWGPCQADCDCCGDLLCRTRGDGVRRCVPPSSLRTTEAKDGQTAQTAARSNRLEAAPVHRRYTPAD